MTYKTDEVFAELESAVSEDWCRACGQMGRRVRVRFETDGDGGLRVINEDFTLHEHQAEA